MLLRRAKPLACLSALVLVTACSSESAPTTGDSSGTGGPSGTSTPETATPETTTPEDEGFVAAPPVTTTPTTVTPGDGPYWPRFHGPNGDNISSDTGLLKKWPDGGPPLDWTCEDIGIGYSSVSLAGGLIYTAGNKDEKTMISAIYMEGNVKWQ